MTWITQPPIDGPVLSSVGPVQRGATVDFTVTAAIVGDGTYCFALDSTSSDDVAYNSREAPLGPEVVITP